MTGMDDPTISCSHLMVELSVLAGWIKKKKKKKILRGVATTPFGRRGLNLRYFSEKRNGKSDCKLIKVTIVSQSFPQKII